MIIQEARDILLCLLTLLEHGVDMYTEYERHEIIQALEEFAIPALEEKIKDKENANVIFPILDIATALNKEELDKQMELYKKHRQVP